MKKILSLFCFLAFITILNAQTQRLVLVEEFTQASCGPCASQNPGFDALLQANPTKVCVIKYHTVWPGVDPMNAQNQSQVATRVTYYGVDGVPMGMYDGKIDSSFANYPGSPGNFTQAIIDNAYAVPSPFTITVNHNLSSDLDSVFATVTVTAAEAVSVGNLKLHVVLVEDPITFSVEPGTNGETTFYNVMREMFPSDQGTAITNTWTSGQSQVFNFAEALPSYIYNLSKLSVVAFIQDNNNKNVKQAAKTAPIPVNVDATVTAVNNLPPFPQCDATPFTASCTFKNFGTTALTSCTLNFQVDNGTIQQVNWTGNLASGATATYNLLPVVPAPGSHTFTVYITNPNGIADYAPANGKKQFSYIILSVFVQVPLVEGFEGATFPPAGWTIVNPDGSYTWSHVTTTGSQGSSSACYILDYLNPTGSLDDLYAKPLDLSTTGYLSYSLTFDVAHAQYATAYTDRLQVQASSNCGSTWSTVYDKVDPALATAPIDTNSYVPSTAAEWRTETVNLSAFVGQSQVLVRFHSISGYSNNLFIDNINITGSTLGIPVVNNNSRISVYPNPSTGLLNIVNAENSGIKVYNILGEEVASVNCAGQSESINLSAFANGTYTIRIVNDNNVFVQKVVLNR
ncbi:MAG: Omp28-related outer membrane protein [Bacteroidia bacterium]|nr:Omp28-related outer membrane protein [Bacteroidia bacterium]